MIILWGSSNAGKKTFIANLHVKCSKESSRWKMKASTEASQRLIQTCTEFLFDKNMFPNVCDENDDIKYFFEIIYNPYPPTQIKQKKIQLIYLDPNGTFFENPDKERLYDNFITDSIKKSFGMILFIDPARQECEENKTSYYKLFSNHISNQIKHVSQGSTSFNKILIPFAICFNKMDLNKYKDYLKNPEKFAMTIMGEDTCSLIERKINKYKYFTVSNVGYYQGDSNTYCDPFGYPKLLQCPEPINIFKPIEWITKQSTKIKMEKNSK